MLSAAVTLMSEPDAVLPTGAEDELVSVMPASETFSFISTSRPGDASFGFSAGAETGVWTPEALGGTAVGVEVSPDESPDPGLVTSTTGFVSGAFGCVFVCHKKDDTRHLRF